MISAVALYFESGAGIAVRPSLYARIVALFEQYHLDIAEFASWPSRYFEDRPHFLAAEGRALARGLSTGAVHNLALYSGPGDRAGASFPRAMATIEMDGGMLFVGIDEDIATDLATLMREAVALAPDLPGLAYGIGFLRDASDEPDCYAAGTWVGTVGELSINWTEADRVGKWYAERFGKRRFLRDMFRGVYHVNLISAAHVRALRDALGERFAELGRYEEVNEALWLWQMPPAQIPSAEALLRAKGLLIA